MCRLFDIDCQSVERGDIDDLFGFQPIEHGANAGDVTFDAGLLQIVFIIQAFEIGAYVLPLALCDLDSGG